MLEALLLGAVQGITEFLPISSTAHLVIVPWFFEWGGLLSSLPFDVALHAGTLFSLLVCFRIDIKRMVLKDRRLFLLILVGTVPAGLAGVFLKDYIGGPLRSPGVIASMLVVFGVVMYVSERFGGKKKMGGIGFRDAVFVGAAQAVALVPGVSRSGVTIAAGLMRGVKREDAARFSFLLSMPAVAGAMVLESAELFSGAHPEGLLQLAAGFAAALLSGVVAIRFLLNYLKRHSLNLFVTYRFVLAGVILGLLWLGG